MEDPSARDDWVGGARGLEGATATEIVSWSVERFGTGLAFACSFQNCALLDVTVGVDPTIEVLFLDTGFHFPETLAFAEELRRRYELNLRVVRPEVEPCAWACGNARCCEVRKVDPLARALSSKRAWMTGLKLTDAPTRATVPVVEPAAPPGRSQTAGAGSAGLAGLVKVNPFAASTDADVESYLDAKRLPRHPLVAQGYRSIGCAPTTRPTAPGEHPRAGRWTGSDKTECGLHA